jgi:NAD(P)-dependent dehydrogenase (short-subunit alcohol dehydrogenase family)
VAVITGAASGIGAETTLLFAERGATVVLLDIDSSGLETMSARLRDAGATQLAITCDHTDQTQVAQASSRVVAEFGRCDILVNNAASRANFQRLEALSLDEWNRVLDINLTGYFLCLQSFGRLMLERKSGVIVNVASPGATHPIPAGGSYSVAYAGRVMLARQAALEWGAYGVRVNAVSVGQTSTAGVSQWHDAETLKKRIELVPLGRLAEPSEQAKVIAFLCSDEASFLTGQEIIVDGGMTQTLLTRVPHPGEVQLFAAQR